MVPFEFSFALVPAAVLALLVAYLVMRYIRGLRWNAQAMKMGLVVEDSYFLKASGVINGCTAQLLQDAISHGKHTEMLWSMTLTPPHDERLVGSEGACASLEATGLQWIGNSLTVNGRGEVGIRHLDALKALSELPRTSASTTEE